MIRSGFRGHQSKAEASPLYDWSIKKPPSRAGVPLTGQLLPDFEGLFEHSTLVNSQSGAGVCERLRRQLSGH